MPRNLREVFTTTKNDYDDSNAHVEEYLVPLDFNGNEKVQLVSNIIPAPEGAPCRTCWKSKKYPPAIWCHGADGKLECILLSAICQECKKLNRNMLP